MRTHASTAAKEWEGVVGDEILRLSLHPTQSNFTGEMAIVGHRGNHMVSLSVSSMISERTARHIAEDNQDRMYFFFMKEGSAFIEMGGAQTVVGPGQAAVVDFSTPHRMTYPAGFHSIGLTVDCSALEASGILTDAARKRVLLASTHDSGAAWLAYVLGSWQLLSEWESPTRFSNLLPELQTAFGMIVSTALDTSSRPGDRHYAAAKGIIERSCHDPNLTPDGIAAFLHVSRRALFRAFAERSTTVGKELTNSRLARAARLLRMDARLTVRSAAQLAGFTSTSSFHARFLENYGMSPRQYARLHSTPGAPSLLGSPYQGTDFVHDVI
ncbi:helix-turn-helix domain-containing protein [Paenarthrobacter nicotinovorans]|uniref:helix-turn-helix domain-containing protein n=1 Tax=Paenarthrobacter nicotinovorans TaxID=29320 RepID=UPI0038055CDF